MTNRKIKAPLDKVNTIIAALDLAATSAEGEMRRLNSPLMKGHAQRWLDSLAETRQWFLDSVRVERKTP